MPRSPIPDKGRCVLTPDEAARVANRNPEQIRQWARDGAIPAVKVGRRWLLDDEALRALESRPRVRMPRPTLEG